MKINKLMLFVLSIMFVSLVTAGIVTISQKTFNSGLTLSDGEIIDINGKDFIKVDLSASREVWDLLEGCKEAETKQILLRDTPANREMLQFAIDNLDNIDLEELNPCATPTQSVRDTGKQYDFADGEFK